MERLLNCLSHNLDWIYYIGIHISDVLYKVGLRNDEWYFCAIIWSKCIWHLHVGQEVLKITGSWSRKCVWSRLWEVWLSKSHLTFPEQMGQIMYAGWHFGGDLPAWNLSSCFLLWLMERCLDVFNSSWWCLPALLRYPSLALVQLTVLCCHASFPICDSRLAFWVKWSNPKW